MPGLSERSSLSKTRPVGTSTPGLTSTRPQEGRAGTAVRVSPMPVIRVGRGAFRQTGTSAPNSSTSASPGAKFSTPQTCDSSRSAAAASEEPLPIPAAWGSVLVSLIRAPCVTPRAACNTRAARSTVLLSSTGTPEENGPVTSSVRSVAGRAVS